MHCRRRPTLQQIFGRRISHGKGPSSVFTYFVFDEPYSNTARSGLSMLKSVLDLVAALKYQRYQRLRSSETAFSDRAAYDLQDACCWPAPEMNKKHQSAIVEWTIVNNDVCTNDHHLSWTTNQTAPRCRSGPPVSTDVCRNLVDSCRS